VVEKLKSVEKATEKVKEKNRLKKLATLGFEGENMGEVIL
jgi:U6 snRNA-associated Sm-like protein LSm1